MHIRRRPPIPTFAISHLSYEISVPGATPNNILEEIVWHKETEIDRLREKTPLKELQKKVQEVPPPHDFLQALKQGKTNPAVIAEVKKASPSKGVIKENFDPVEIALSYQKGGASCLSVLTDEKFFQGSFANLAKIREVVNLPLLCKEFIIYPYQIYLARSYGADAVLLIAAILNDKDLQYFLKIINKLGMTALIEVHTLEELDRVLKLQGVQLVGINNRNLENFTVDLQTTVNISQARQTELEKRDILLVSESGLHNPEHINLVKTAGAKAVLIGESIVKQADPGAGITSLFS